MITFKELMKSQHLLSDFTITQTNPVKKTIHGIYADLRVDKTTVPAGWHAYDIRDDGDGNFATIEPDVMVNHAGTVLFKEPLDFPPMDSNHNKDMLILEDFEETNKDTADADYTF